MSKDISNMLDTILHIDTSNREKTIVSLHIGDKIFTKEESSPNFSSQSLLPLIDTILKEHEVTYQDLSGIEVNTCPGSFTGLRVGASIANTLGWLLDIPVNGKKGKIVEPEYESTK